MPRRAKFDLYVGIDYSGAGTPQSELEEIQIFQVQHGQEPQKVTRPGPQPGDVLSWSRESVAEWVIALATSGGLFILGIDHALSFPQQYFERFGLLDWELFLQDFSHHWPTHQPGATVQGLREGNERVGDPSWLRLTEIWSRSAKSVFRFGIPGQVAPATHAGIPWIEHIRAESNRTVHFWPFDGWVPPNGASVILEAYPALVNGRYETAGRTQHEHDAYSVAKWLKRLDHLGALGCFFDPPLLGRERRRAGREGWILGVT